MRSPVWLALLVLLTAAANAQQSPPPAFIQKVALNIASQPVADALSELGRQTGLGIVVYSSLGRGVTAPKLEGQYTPAEALARILTPAGLHAEYLDEKTVAVLESDSKPANSTSRVASAAAATQSFRVAKGQSSDEDAAQPESAVPTSTNVRRSDNKTHERLPLEEVVITGTHIRGEAPIGARMLTLERSEIEQSGYSTTEQLIQSVPQNFRGGAAGASADANFSSGVNAGYNGSFGSGVNFRGLGNTATLVLVNGHRVASAGGGYFTDISTIPLSAIEHIDVLTDGASAVYGSDAIAGVVNIVLKRESQGIEVEVRSGKTAGSWFSASGASARLGDKWSSGGATLGADFSHQGSLDASQRPYTSYIPTPTSIFPSYNQIALTAAARQGFGDRFEFHGDAQYTKTAKTAFLSSAPPTLREDPAVKRWSGSIGGSYQISDYWAVRYDYSRGDGDEDTTNAFWAAGQTPSFDSRIDVSSRFSEHSATASGDLFSLPGGSVKLAVGASYRTEGFTQDFNSASTELHYNADRNVTAEYGEIRVPVFSELNARSGLRKLTLSAAVRHDRYSDFGDTTNPKFGISWFPVDRLGFRGAYSTSFRAPATGLELVNSQLGTSAVLVSPYPSPDQSTQVPVVVLLGGRRNIKKKTARNLTLGFDYELSAVPKARLSFNYYDITYSHQLATPPFPSGAPLSNSALASVVTKYSNSAALQSLVNAAIQNGALYLDFTSGAFGPDPLATATYLYNDRIQNLSKTETSGFDATVSYPFVFGTERVESRIEATYIEKFSSELTSGSPQVSEVNTVGYPARIRARGQETWTHGSLAVSLAANFVNSYPDTSVTTLRNVGSFTTVDLVARYAYPGRLPSALYGFVVTFTVINAFDRRPPYVVSGTPSLPDSHYDPANGSPLGRFVTLQLSKQL